MLVKALDGDLQHARYHTLLLIKALEWEKHDFEKSLLLHGISVFSFCHLPIFSSIICLDLMIFCLVACISGNDLKRAQQWLTASALGKEPKPTTLHLSFITARFVLK